MDESDVMAVRRPEEVCGLEFRGEAGDGAVGAVDRLERERDGVDLAAGTVGLRVGADAGEPEARLSDVGDGGIGGGLRDEECGAVGGEMRDGGGGRVEECLDGAGGFW